MTNTTNTELDTAGLRAKAEAMRDSHREGHIEYQVAAGFLPVLDEREALLTSIDRAERTLRMHGFQDTGKPEWERAQAAAGAVPEGWNEALKAAAAAVMHMPLREAFDSDPCKAMAISANAAILNLKRAAPPPQGLPAAPTDAELVKLMKAAESASPEVVRAALQTAIDALCKIASATTPAAALSEQAEAAPDWCERQTLAGMAECMDVVRAELIEARVIPADTPPMMVANAVIAKLRQERAKQSAAPSEPTLEGLNMEVIRRSYGWTLDADGELLGLTNGDMGYDKTGVKLDGFDLETWKAATSPIQQAGAAPSEPVLWFRRLEAAHALPDGRCYSVVFTPVPDHQPLFATPPAQDAGTGAIVKAARLLAECFPSRLGEMYCDGEPVGRKLVALVANSGRTA